MEEMESCLDMFKKIHLSYMPFVLIPDTMTARDLRASRPFFFMCILACTHKVTSVRYAIGDKAREVLSQRVIMANDRSIDLLLGLITMLAW